MTVAQETGAQDHPEILGAASGGGAPEPLAAALRQAAAAVDAWEPLRLVAGTQLFDLGDPADAFYVVREGELEVFLPNASGTRVVLERLRPGSSFGELALLDGGPRSASVAALTDVVLNRLRRDDFLAALAGSPEIAVSLLGTVGERLRRNMGYVDHLLGWARLIAEGRYAEAEAAMRQAGEATGGHSARFSRTFADMIAAMRAREAALERELVALRVEIDQVKHAQQVAEITESDFFRRLAAEARRLRGRDAGTTGGEAEGEGRGQG